jgi:hypothetical protein
MCLVFFVVSILYAADFVPSQHVNWYKCLYVRGEKQLTMLKILGTSVQNLVTYGPGVPDIQLWHFMNALSHMPRDVRYLMNALSRVPTYVCLLRLPSSFSPSEVFTYCKILLSDQIVTYRSTACDKRQNVGGIKQPNWEDTECVCTMCIHSRVINSFY